MSVPYIKSTENEPDGEEIWKPVTEEGYSHYSVSNMGRVRSEKSQRILRPINNPETGYVSAHLAMSTGERKVVRVHRLVAMAFIDNPDPINNTVVDHKNGIRNDNVVSNLSWVSVSENCNNKIFNSYGENNSRKISQYNLENDEIKIWNSMREIKEVLSIGFSRIIEACKSGNTCEGFIWKYHEIIIENEEWRDLIIDGVPIEVSSMGRAKLVKKIATYGSNQGGYLTVGIKRKRVPIHRLICMAFKPVENFEDYVVNHIDNDRKNNKIENLEVITQKENINHAIAFRNKKSEKGRPVAQLSIDTEEVIATYPSIKQASEKVGIGKVGISYACIGRTKSSGGYKWKYLST